MLNPKKILSEAQEKHEAKHKADFGEDVFFEKNHILQVIHSFRPEKDICVG
jgi:hypothetical protein